MVGYRQTCLYATVEYAGHFFLSFLFVEVETCTLFVGRRLILGLDFCEICYLQLCILITSFGFLLLRDFIQL